MKWTYASLLVVLSVSGPIGAQYYVRPPTNPYFRPQLSPYFTYYYGPGAMTGPYVVPPPLALGGVRPAYPGVAPFGGYGPGGLAVQAAGGEAATGQTTFNPNDTGHPTRFMAYSQYFLNQGGTGTTAAATAVAPGTQPFGGAVVGTGAFQRPVIAGTAPPRGRANVRPGGR